MYPSVKEGKKGGGRNEVSGYEIFQVGLSVFFQKPDLFRVRRAWANIRTATTSDSSVAEGEN